MKKIVVIGEALLDFISDEEDMSLSDVTSFSVRVGGGPLNVLGAFSHLGGNGHILTALGNDPFGRKILTYLKSNGLSTEYIVTSRNAKTALAFVSHHNKDRDFFFPIKKPSYLEYKESYIKEEAFSDAFLLHFSSVALMAEPMLSSHLKAIDIARKKGMLICFDLNLRRQIYNNDHYLKEIVNKFIPLVDIIKISDDELEFLYPNRPVLDSLKYLLESQVKLVLYTAGSNGSIAVYKDLIVKMPSINVNVVDTTGAGDAFIASFIFQLAHNKNYNLDFTSNELRKYLEFSNIYAALSTTKKGALDSYLSFKEFVLYLNKKEL